MRGPLAILFIFVAAAAIVVGCSGHSTIVMPQAASQGARHLTRIAPRLPSGRVILMLFKKGRRGPVVLREVDATTGGAPTQSASRSSACWLGLQLSGAPPKAKCIAVSRGGAVRAVTSPKPPPSPAQTPTNPPPTPTYSPPTPAPIPSS